MSIGQATTSGNSATEHGRHAQAEAREHADSVRGETAAWQRGLNLWKLLATNDQMQKWWLFMLSWVLVMWSPGLKTTSEPWLGTANRRFAERPSRSTENDAGTKLYIKVTPEHSLSNPQSELAATCDPISLHPRMESGQSLCPALQMTWAAEDDCVILGTSRCQRSPEIPHSGPLGCGKCSGTEPNSDCCCTHL